MTGVQTCALPIYGDVIRAEIEKRLGLWLTAFVILLASGFVIAIKLI